MFGSRGKKAEAAGLPEVPEEARNLLEPRFSASAGGVPAATNLSYDYAVGALVLAGMCAASMSFSC